MVQGTGDQFGVQWRESITMTTGDRVLTPLGIGTLVAPMPNGWLVLLARKDFDEWKYKGKFVFKAFTHEQLQPAASDTSQP